MLLPLRSSCFRLPLLCVLVFDLAITLVSAGSAEAQSLPVYSARVTRILYDFDANGTTDATDEITYDAEGHPATASYVYTGDGTPDLLNTRDDDTVTEDAVFVFDANHLLVMATIDRGFERFESTNTFVGTQLTRVDVEQLDGSGTTLSEDYSLFGYTAGDLVQIENFDAATNGLLATFSIGYGGDGLPQSYDLASSGIGIDNSLTWRPDGQPATISSVAVGVAGTGSATYGYDAQGRPASEVWTQTGFVGSLLSEFPGRAYRKTFFYDGSGRKSREEIDVDDDSILDAIITLEWESGDCRPAFQWAANGRPNFVASPDIPFVPGTGVRQIEYCPEPSFAFMIAVGTIGLAWNRGRKRARRARSF